jgi:FKBP-type peptidyl-prolyl cis-trans isomerase
MKLFIPVLCAAILLTIACGGSPTDPSVNTNAPYSQTDLTVGSGKVVAAGNTVSTNYTLWLYDPAGTDKKGSQIQTGAYSFVVGANPPQAIAGVDQGVVGMAVGGKRRLIIPPSLGYGSAGNSGIPGNATLVFEVEVLNVT